MQEGLMKKERYVTISEGNELCFRYEIISSNDMFGIRISTYSGGECIDFAEINNICKCALEMQSIFVVLLEYTVTPTTVYDILDLYFDDPEHFCNLAEELR